MGIKQKMPLTQEQFDAGKSSIHKKQNDMLRRLESMAATLEQLCADNKELRAENELLTKKTNRLLKYYKTRRYDGWYSANLPTSVKNHLYPELNEMTRLFHRPSDFPRLYSIVLNVNRVLRSGVDGSFAEVGVFRGQTSAVLMHYCVEHKRKLFMFDTFEGFSQTDLQGVDSDIPRADRFNENSLEAVKEYVGDNEWGRYIQGYFPESATEESTNEKYAFVSLDCDLYNPTLAGLEFFWPRLSEGGMIFVHDYSSEAWQGCKQAVDEFLASFSQGLRAANTHTHTPAAVLLPDMAGSIVLIK